MGVPTLSIDGQTIAARSSAAILGQVGLDGFLAKDLDDFVANGVAWSTRLVELGGLRRRLRETCDTSIKSCPDILSMYINKAFRQMWERWCEGMDSETFIVKSYE